MPASLALASQMTAARMRMGFRLPGRLRTIGSARRSGMGLHHPRCKPCRCPRASLGCTTRYSMPRPSLPRFAALAALAALAVGTAGPASAADTVLVVHSYHVGYNWTDTIQAGIEEAMQGSGARIEVHYMDAKRKSSVEERSAAGAAALARVAELKPRVVITSDDAAQAFFAKDLAGKPGAPAIVFNGVNAEAAKYGYPAANVTGILERPHVTQCLEFVARIVPGAKSVAFIADPSDVTEAMVPFFKAQAQPVPIVAYDTARTVDEWKALVARHQDKDAILVHTYQSLKEADGSPADPKAVMAWTVANTKRPLVGVYDFAVREGAVFGITESAKEHGQESGRLAREILAGRAPGELPIATAKHGLVMFNLTSAKALGVQIPFELLELASETIGQ